MRSIKDFKDAQEFTLADGWANNDYTQNEVEQQTKRFNLNFTKVECEKNYLLGLKR